MLAPKGTCSKQDFTFLAGDGLLVLLCGLALVKKEGIWGFGALTATSCSIAIAVGVVAGVAEVVGLRWPGMRRYLTLFRGLVLLAVASVYFAILLDGGKALVN